MKAKTKPKYSVWSNVRYMLTLAWNSHKSVLWMCAVWAALSLSINLVQLFIAPVILQKVETMAPLSELLGAIGVFTAALIALNGLLGYVDENILYGRISIRTLIILDINGKPAPHPTPTAVTPKF